MNKLLNILWSPFPVAFAAILISQLSWASVRDRWWAKVGRTICIIFIILNAYYGINGFNAKVAAGSHISELYFIVKFDKQIMKLIEENKIEKAKELLAQFNERYPVTAGNDKEKRELLQQLMKESQ